MRDWKTVDWGDECPICGDGVEILTNEKGDDMGCDGDNARCTDCGHRGTVSVDEDGLAWIDWDDEVSE